MLTVVICVLIGFGLFYFTRPERVSARVVVSSPFAIGVVIVSAFLGTLLSIILGALFADGYYSKVLERRLAPTVVAHQTQYLNTSMGDDGLCIGFSFFNENGKVESVNFTVKGESLNNTSEPFGHMSERFEIIMTDNAYEPKVEVYRMDKVSGFLKLFVIKSLLPRIKLYLPRN